MYWSDGRRALVLGLVHRRILVKKFKLSAKIQPELARPFQKEESTVAEIQLRASVFPLDSVTLTRSDLSVVSSLTCANTPKTAIPMWTSRRSEAHGEWHSSALTLTCLYTHTSTLKVHA